MSNLHYIAMYYGEYEVGYRFRCDTRKAHPSLDAAVSYARGRVVEGAGSVKAEQCFIYPCTVEGSSVKIAEAPVRLDSFPDEKAWDPSQRMSDEERRSLELAAMRLMRNTEIIEHVHLGSGAVQIELRRKS